MWEAQWGLVGVTEAPVLRAGHSWGRLVVLGALLLLAGVVALAFKVYAGRRRAASASLHQAPGGQAQPALLKQGAWEIGIQWSIVQEIDHEGPWYIAKVMFSNKFIAVYSKMFNTHMT